MEDSFAERMRKRAVERFKHIVDEDYDHDTDCPSVSKKIKSPSFVETEKENLNDIKLSSNPTKPIIAEHLTVCKSSSIEKMDCDEPGVFIMRSRKKPVLFPEEECISLKQEDKYVKKCKNQLDILAKKFKTFEEDEQPVKAAAKHTPAKETVKKYPVHVKLDSNSNNMKITASPKKHSIVCEESKTHQKVLDESVVNTLESQGFKRTISDAHLFYDFKTAKKNFNKENTNVNAVPKPKRHLEAVKIQPKKSDPKEISNIFSNSKFQKNVFVQNCRKINEEGNGNPDPSLLSVAERRHLFEKRSRGEIDMTSHSPIVSVSSPVIMNQENNHNVHTESDESEEYHSGNEFGECVNESNYESESTDYEVAGSSQTHTSDGDISSENELKEDDKEADLSAYPVLQTVKQVKFASTPKPGRLYPSVSDLDGEVEEDIDASKIDSNSKTANLEDSFGKEVLCATNTIFSSFQNSRRENSDFEKPKNDVLSDVKELISPGNNISLSLNSTAKLSTTSVECPNETASFTFLKTFSNHSVDGSSLPTPFNSRNSNMQDGIEGEEESDRNAKTNNEIDVNEKIQFLEELIVKEKIILAQEIRALKYCLSTSFMNSTSHLEAEKLVLLSQLKIEEIQNEIQRIKVENSVQPAWPQNSVRGNVVISNIRLPIKSAVVRANLKEDIENNLLCVVKCGETVLATEVVPVTQSKMKQDIDGSCIEFPDKLTVPNVTSDFKIRVEVYNLLIEKKDFISAKGKDKHKKNLKNAKKIITGLPGQYFKDRKTPHSSFIMIGYMMFSQNLAQRHQWMLNKHHLPLVGMIMMSLKFNLDRINVVKRGFLTMYEIISGYGAWSRYWFLLNGDKLSFWKYPEMEAEQDPIYTLDMKKCISKDVVVVGYDIVFRPQTFILKFDPPTYLQQFKGLTEDRLLLSADTEEDRISWCSCLNEVLKSVRSWSSPVE